MYIYPFLSPLNSLWDVNEFYTLNFGANLSVGLRVSFSSSDNNEHCFYQWNFTIYSALNESFPMFIKPDIQTDDGFSNKYALFVVV